MVANKITWQQAGHVTEPGRYMFRFGWLTVTAEDFAHNIGSREVEIEILP